MTSELRKSISRNDHFTLAQKRVLKDIIKATAQEVANIKAAIPEPTALYGGSLLYGTVTWLSGLTFAVSDAGYIIDGNAYTSQATEVTLDPADGSNPRIDVIYADSSGAIGTITGTAAADPAKPEVDSLTQLELTFVSVAASATTPTEIAASDLYAENAGDTAEWDATESTSTARITLGSTADPYAGTKSILFDAAVQGDTVTLTDGGGTGIIIADMASLETHVKVAAWGKRNSIRVAWFDGALRISSWVQISDGNYGFDRTNSGAYQTVTIPKADFQLGAGTADSLVFEVRGGGSVTVHLDQVRVQAGDGVTVINNYNGLTEEELINNVRTWNAQQPFGNDTLTDGATIAWDLDVSPVASVTIDGNRTINFSNARAGGTYILKVKQDATTGSRLVTWNANIKWAGGSAPTLTTDTNGEDLFTFIAFDSTSLYGVSGGLAFA
jgi:hypothetical protein